MDGLILSYPLAKFLFDEFYSGIKGPFGLAYF